MALQQAYLRVVGLEEELQGSHTLPTFTYASKICTRRLIKYKLIRGCSMVAALLAGI